MATRTIPREKLRGGDILILAPPDPTADEIRVPLKRTEVEGQTVRVFPVNDRPFTLYREGLAKVERAPG